jgi:hypothetical protein
MVFMPGSNIFRGSSPAMNRREAKAKREEARGKNEQKTANKFFPSSLLPLLSSLINAAFIAPLRVPAMHFASKNRLGVPNKFYLNIFLQNKQ